MNFYQSGSSIVFFIKLSGQSSKTQLGLKGKSPFSPVDINALF